MNLLQFKTHKAITTQSEGDIFCIPLKLAYHKEINGRVLQRIVPCSRIFRGCGMSNIHNLKATQVVYSIQIQLFLIAQYHKLQISLGGLYNLDTYHIPDLWPHVGSGKTTRRNLQESNRWGSLSRMDWRHRCHVTRWIKIQSYNTFNEYDRHYE